MASVAVQTYLTPEKYLAFEHKATTKHEYLNGQIIAMPRASFAHNFITVNIATSLNLQLMEGEFGYLQTRRGRFRLIPKVSKTSKSDKKLFVRDTKILYNNSGENIPAGNSFLNFCTD